MAVKMGGDISDRASQCSDRFSEKESESRNIKWFTIPASCESSGPHPSPANQSGWKVTSGLNRQFSGGIPQLDDFLATSWNSPTHHKSIRSSLWSFSTSQQAQPSPLSNPYFTNSVKMADDAQVNIYPAIQTPPTPHLRLGACSSYRFCQLRHLSGHCQLIIRIA
jgi:hypothetical protein